MGDLRRAVAAAGATRDARVRQALARSWIDVELFRLHNARTLDRLTRGEELGAESSIVTHFWAEMSRRFAETAVDLLGPSALLTDGDARWARGLLSTCANSIMGGTSEIQRTIIGERILGLPREPLPSAEEGTSK
jgi:alkylation response protein AidB-like acyl-CoA dehydrogenase